MNQDEHRGTSQRRARGKSGSLDSETLAIEALRFFGANPREAERFFAWSGLDAATVRAAASQPAFGFGVLHYLAQDEPLLLSFAAHAQLDPADIAAACEASLAREASGDANR